MTCLTDNIRFSLMVYDLELPITAAAQCHSTVPDGPKHPMDMDVQVGIESISFHRSLPGLN